MNARCEEMNALGIKVLLIGFIVSLFSASLGLYYSWQQFSVYVIQDGYRDYEEVKTEVTGFLFASVFSVIGVLIAVIGVAIMLRTPQT